MTLRILRLLKATAQGSVSIVFYEKNRKTALFDTIQKNKLPLLSSPPATKENSSDRLKIAPLKTNGSLFSRLYVSCQVRNGDLEGFYAHENQSFTPSLSQYGKLRSGTKSDLLSCLERNGPAQAQKSSVEAVLLDGAAVVNMLKPGASNTFQEYSETVFLPYLINQLRNVDRVDVVWHRYLPSSLKILHEVREEWVSVDTSDLTPGSQEIGQPS